MCNSPRSKMPWQEQWWHISHLKENELIERNITTTNNVPMRNAK